MLHKYLNGEADARETALLKEDPEFASYLLISDASAEFETPEFRRDKIYDQIMEKRSETASRPIPLARTLLKIAAVLALVVTAYLYFGNLQTNVNTSIAETKSFTLPDASEVTLNSNSSIDYKKKNWENNRKLQLDGEAYFKVSKGNKFDVETSQGTVSVLGTQFNVFSRDTIFNVKCFEGLVSVAFTDTVVKVAAGNKLKIENGVLTVLTKTNSSSPSWINNESSFENASLATVINELQHQYPIKITSPEHILNKRFTGSFTHKDLEIALRSVCEPLRLKYSIDGESVQIYAP